MKSICLIILLWATLSSCTHNSRKEVPVATVDGLFRVGYFYDSGDKTAMFFGYTFDFAPGNLLKVKKGATEQIGKWQESSTELTISNLPNSDPLKELNEDWTIQQKTPGVIKLKDGNDEVHFVRQ